jgi:hypothetical protein
MRKVFQASEARQNRQGDLRFGAALRLRGRRRERAFEAGGEKEIDRPRPFEPPLEGGEPSRGASTFSICRTRRSRSGRRVEAAQIRRQRWMSTAG